MAGNPLALVELAGELTPGELSGAVPLGWPLRFGGRLEELYLARVRALPADTQTLLLVAAADPTGDPALVAEGGRAAGHRSGGGRGGGDGPAGVVGAAGAVPAPADPVGGVLRGPGRGAARARMPRWPRSPTPALTRTGGPGTGPRPPPGPDEQVAAELERSAGRAQARGGLAAAGAFLERAAALTPDPARRAGRALDAAQANVRAGAFGKARDLLAAAEGRAAG